MNEDRALGKGLPADPRWGEESEDLYRRYFPRLVRFCRHRTVDRTEAEDLAQEAMLRALLRMNRFDATRPLWPWLKAIAANVVADRARRRTRELLVEAVPERADPGKELGRIEDREALKAALSRLSLRQQRALDLRYVEERNARDAGALLGLTPLAFRQLLYRARARLREELHRLGQDGLGLAWPAIHSVRVAWRRARTQMSERWASGPGAATADALVRLVPLLLTLPLLSGGILSEPPRANAKPSVPAEQRPAGPLLAGTPVEEVLSPGRTPPGLTSRPEEHSDESSSDGERGGGTPGEAGGGGESGVRSDGDAGGAGGGGGGTAHLTDGIDTSPNRYGDDGASYEPSPVPGHLVGVLTGGVACSPTICDNDLVTVELHPSPIGTDDLVSFRGP